MTTPARFMLLSLITALLTSCGSSSSSTQGERSNESGGDPSSTPPRVDVAWSSRVDHEAWESPLPSGQDGWPSEPPSRWPALRARVIAPPTATPGETLDYVIVLRNMTDAPIDLRPCGGYEQEVMGLGPGLAAVPLEGGTSTFRLNCDAEPILSSAESRRYAMRVVVPPDLTGAEVLLRWGFVDNMPDYDAQRWIGLTTS